MYAGILILVEAMVLLFFFHNVLLLLTEQVPYYICTFAPRSDMALGFGDYGYPECRAEFEYEWTRSRDQNARAHESPRRAVRTAT